MEKENMCTKGIVIGILMLFLLILIPLTGSRAPQVTPQDYTSIDLNFDVPNLVYGTISTPQGEFATIEIPNEGFTTTIGEPQLPVMTRMVEIPQGATPQLSITTSTWETTTLTEQGLPNTIYPMQASVQKIQDRDIKNDITINPSVYSEESITPTVVATISDIVELRGHRIAVVQVSPIQYNPLTEVLHIMRNAQIHIELPGSDISLTSALHERYASVAFTDLLKNTITNYDSFNGADDFSRDNLGYLVIVYDSFYEEIQPLVTWKQNHGFTVTVTKTTQIPGGATTTNIKNYITTAYNTWSPPPSYVLLVGDTAQIPSWTGTQTGTCTDLYYVTISVPDYFADIFVSRFPAATEAQVTTMVDKTLYYEQANFASTDWIKKAAFMASNDNYPVSEGTHNYVISTYLQPHGYTCDKLYCHTYGATTQQVRNALNNGRSLAVYSGHGSETSWADGPYFSQSDVNGLTNSNMYPFVCSHACLTGKFSTSECFGETWLRATNKAGLAFWGASTYTYWDEDDILEKKMFSAWWDENLLTIGAMTDRAKALLYQYYGGGGMTKYYFEAYNVLGDSSVQIWREIPNQIDPAQSFVTLTHTNMPGMTTCPKGDGPAYKYVKVTVKNTQGQPVSGIPASGFTFQVMPLPGTRYYGLFTVTLNPVDIQTNVSGEIRFNITTTTSIVGNVTIKATVQGVRLNDIDTLGVKSYDMIYPDGDVDLSDFALFAQDYFRGTAWRSDYSWDGLVNLIDFSMFAPHYGHRHP